MKINQKSAYAFKDSLLTHISEVSRGLACGCICIECGHMLIAKKGLLKAHHFAHHIKSDCVGASETLLHMLAKELFKELDVITIPEYYFNETRKLKNGLEITHKQQLLKGGNAKITRVLLEQSLQKIRPDVIIESGDKKLLIEIAVTHKADKTKIREIRQNDMPAIEIQLDFADALLSREELKEKLKNHLDSKRWLFHPKQREAEREYIRQIRQAIRNNKILRNIPHSPKHGVTSPYNGSYINSLSLGSASSRFSNAKNDRMAYEFYSIYSRQPTDEEYPRLYSILYGRKQIN